MKKSEFDKLVGEIVEQKIRDILPKIIAEVIYDAAAGVVTEHKFSEPTRPSATITENVATQDTNAARMAIRAKFANSMNGSPTAAVSPLSFNTNDVIMVKDLEHGIERPVAASAIPESVRKALTKDYSEVMAAMKRH